MSRNPDDYTIYDEWAEEQEYSTEQLMDDERGYYGKTAEILSHGSREDVRRVIRNAEREGRCAYDIQDAMLGAEYPIDTGGFTGTNEQYQMVLDEMRRYGDESGDDNWANAASLVETDLGNRGWDGLGPIQVPHGIRDSFGGSWKKAKSVAKGIGTTLGGLAGTVKAATDAPRTGDIDVSAYDYRRNGKRVHVDAHKRKRS